VLKAYSMGDWERWYVCWLLHADVGGRQIRRGSCQSTWINCLLR